MQIEAPTQLGWSGLRLTVIDNGAQGDDVISDGPLVKVCLHKEDDQAEMGATTYLLKSDFLRLARMIEANHG